MTTTALARQKKRSYSDEDRRQTVTLYLVHGSMEKVSKQTGMPVRTLRDWRNQSEWWGEIEASVRAQVTDRIRAQVDEIIELAHGEVVDRLQSGDFKVVNKKLERVPISAKDAAWIYAVNFDKRQVLSNQPTSLTGNAVDGRIAAYLEKFGALGRALEAKTIEGEIVEGDDDPIV